MNTLPNIDRIAPLIDAPNGEDFFIWTSETETLVAIGARVRAVLRGRTIEIAGEASEAIETIETNDPFAAVPELLGRLAPPSWRAFGYIAFDACSFFRPYTKRSSAPSLELIVPRVLLSFVRDGQVHVSAPDDEREAISAMLSQPAKARPSIPPSLSTSFVDDEREEYERAVRGALAAIHADRLQKVILARHLTIPGKLDVLGTYRAARSVPTLGRRFSFRFGSVRGAGFCPASLLTASADRNVMTNPLAGTRPRGKDRAEDAQLVRALLSDAKELSEHAMSIRCAYDELADVCSPTTLRVIDFMRVKTYPFTHHLSSSAAGTLASSMSSWDALRAVFPGVTATGVDKAIAIELIEALERGPRGLYAGAVGCVDHEGVMDWGIALRAAFDYGAGVCVSAGAGIVRDSNVEVEFQESANKMRTVASRLVLAAR